MAAYAAARSVHKTLGAGVEDVVTLNQRWPAVEIYNRDAAGTIYVTTNNSAVVAAADNTEVVGPGQTVTLSPESFTGTTLIIRLISAAACPYSITGLR